MLPPFRPSLSALLWLFVGAAISAPCRQASGADADADTLGGIVVNRSVTVAGQEFTQHFLSAWREHPGSEHLSLTIVERPSARWGSEVWIEYAQRRVFHTRLPTMRAALRQAGERAADLTFDTVLQAERQRKLIHDADLAPDEI